VIIKKEIDLEIFNGFTGSETPEYVKVVFGMPLDYLSVYPSVCMCVCVCVCVCVCACACMRVCMYSCVRAIQKAISAYFRQLM
jgi:hypothetical protein